VTPLDGQEREPVIVRWPWKRSMESNTRVVISPLTLAIHRRVEMRELALQAQRRRDV
jgi:hypothetical protein